MKNTCPHESHLSHNTDDSRGQTKIGRAPSLAADLDRVTAGKIPVGGSDDTTPAAAAESGPGLILKGLHLAEASGGIVPGRRLRQQDRLIVKECPRPAVSLARMLSQQKSPAFIKRADFSIRLPPAINGDRYHPEAH